MLYHHAIYEFRTPQITKVTMTSKVEIAEDERTAKQFSSKKVLELLLDNVFYLYDGCSSDEECSEVSLLPRK